MDVGQQYDMIILGTGIVEAILAGLFAANEKKKILVIDRGSTYGGQFPTLNLKQFFQKYMKDQTIPEQFGNNLKWNLSLLTKVVFCEDRITKLLFNTKSSNYIQWRTIQASFTCIFRERSLFKHGLRLYRIPSKPRQGMFSDMMGMLEKRKLHKFLDNIMRFDLNDRKTHGQIKINGNSRDSAEIYEFKQQSYELASTCLAGYSDDRYKRVHVTEYIERMQMYRKSMLTDFGSSPYLYPIFGIGNIADAFLRNVPINGGQIKLETHISQFITKDNMIKGVKTTDNKTYWSNTVICDPSYAQNCGYKDHVFVKERIIRCLCIIDEQIKEIKEIDKYNSGLIIIQNKTRNLVLDRNTNTYMLFLSEQHQVCKSGYYVVMIVAKLQKDQKNPYRVINYPLELLGNPKKKCIQVFQRYVPFGSIDDSFEADVSDQTIFPKKPEQKKVQKPKEPEKPEEREEEEMLEMGEEEKKEEQQKKVEEVKAEEVQEEVKEEVKEEVQQEEYEDLKKIEPRVATSNPLKGLYITKDMSYEPYFEHQVDDILSIYEKLTEKSTKQMNYILGKL